MNQLSYSKKDRIEQPTQKRKLSCCFPDKIFSIKKTTELPSLLDHPTLISAISEEKQCGEEIVELEQKINSVCAQEKERENLHQLMEWMDSDSMWKLVKENKGVAVYQAPQNEKDVLIRANTTVNCTVTTLANFLWKSPIMKSIDKMTETFSEVVVDEENKIVHNVWKMPWPLKPRDFVLHCFRSSIGNKYYIVCHSVIKEHYLKKKNVVRGDTAIKGWFISPNPKNPLLTDVSIIFHISFQRSLPAQLQKSICVTRADLLRQLKKYWENHVDPRYKKIGTGTTWTI